MNVRICKSYLESEGRSKWCEEEVAQRLSRRVVQICCSVEFFKNRLLGYCANSSSAIPACERGRLLCYTSMTGEAGS